SQARDFSRRRSRPTIHLSPMSFPCQLFPALSRRTMAARGRGISSDIALRITPKWDIEFGEAFITLNPPQGKAVNGFDNLSIGSKYEFFENDEHEAVVSLGLGVDVGGTGSKEMGADTFSTWTPGIFL